MNETKMRARAMKGFAKLGIKEVKVGKSVLKTETNKNGIRRIIRLLDDEDFRDNFKGTKLIKYVSECYEVRKIK